MAEIACVGIVPEKAVDAEVAVAGMVPDSRFADFVEKVERTADKSPLIDRFMTEQEVFPVIEGDSLVHFVYRGTAADVALAGDLVGWRFDQPLHRIDGTDLFYYSSHLEPDARITYKFTLDLQESVPDPLNPRQISTLYFGRASSFAMPQWQVPDYLEERGGDDKRGRIDSLRFKSARLEEERILEVYLPADYKRHGDHYPVVYVHASRRHRDLGKMDLALDHLIGRRVRPVIVVFLPSLIGGGYAEYIGARRHEYERIFADEVVPLVDRTYRTIAARLSPGCWRRGVILLPAAE